MIVDLELVLDSMARLYGVRLVDLGEELRMFGTPMGTKFAQIYGEDGSPTGVLTCYFACGESRAALSFCGDESISDIRENALRAILHLRAFEDDRLKDIAELERLLTL